MVLNIFCTKSNHNFPSPDCGVLRSARFGLLFIRSRSDGGGLLDASFDSTDEHLREAENLIDWCLINVNLSDFLMLNSRDVKLLMLNSIGLTAIRLMLILDKLGMQSQGAKIMKGPSPYTSTYAFAGTSSWCWGPWWITADRFLDFWNSLGWYPPTRVRYANSHSHMGVS